MGIGDIAGFGSIDMSGLWDKVLTFAGVFVLILLLGGIVTAFFVLKNKKKKKGEAFKIGWWVEVGDRMEASHVDEVQEIIMGGTTLRIFYNKKKDLWLPRFTRGVSSKLFYVCLTPTNQMINFSIPRVNKYRKEAELEFDHTDMLWAAENSREYIKRNYKDKAVKWWQLYQNTIATVALIIVFTFCFIMIIFFMRNIMQDLSGLVGQVGSLVKTSCAAAQTSGVVGA